MIRIDLVTGFLGSGKTTFIAKYASWLLKQGEHLAILENDYGAINVDRMLLQHELGDGADLEMVIGGDGYEAHRRRFRTKLIQLAMVGYTRVIVEPSGIYDVDEFFDVLNEDPIDTMYEAGNVISVLDARLPEDLSDESEYTLVSETADCGILILSRTQQASAEQCSRTLAHVNAALERFQCRRHFSEEDVLLKPWSELMDEDFTRISRSGYSLNPHLSLQTARENGFKSVFYMKLSVSPDELLKLVRAVFDDPACGKIYRVKGFLLYEGQWYELNADREQILFRKASSGQEVVILIGENLDKDRIDTYFMQGEYKPVTVHA